MMTRCTVVFLLTLIATPLVAVEAPYVMGIAVDLDHELFAVTSPSPVCWQYFDVNMEGNEDLEFHQEYTNDVTPCIGGWLLHCDGDSLSYTAGWVEEDPENWHWNFQHYTVEMSASIYFAEGVILKAARASSGHLSTDEHYVTIQRSGQDPIALLGAESDDLVELEIEEGIYTIVLHVLAYESGTHYTYSGAVHVWWESSAAAEASTWSAVKNLYR